MVLNLTLLYREVGVISQTCIYFEALVIDQSIVESYLTSERR